MLKLNRLREEENFEEEKMHAVKAEDEVSEISSVQKFKLIYYSIVDCARSSIGKKV